MSFKELLSEKGCFQSHFVCVLKHVISQLTSQSSNTTKFMYDRKHEASE